MELLHSELIYYLCYFLDANGIAQLSCTCRKYHNLLDRTYAVKWVKKKTDIGYAPTAIRECKDFLRLHERRIILLLSFIRLEQYNNYYMYFRSRNRSQGWTLSRLLFTVLLYDKRAHRVLEDMKKCAECEAPSIASQLEDILKWLPEPRLNYTIDCWDDKKFTGYHIL